jgi:guanylate kinase
MNLKSNNSEITIVVSAPSGTGKSTIIGKLLSEDDSYTFVVSTTTRKMREGENESRNYYYTSLEDFQNKIRNDEFLEWAIVHKNYYGTTKKEIDRISRIGRIPLFDVDVQGARNLKQKLSDAVYIFIIPPSYDILRERLSKRNTETEEQIGIRMQNAVDELKEFVHYDYIVVNDTVEKACSDIKAIVKAEACRVSRFHDRIQKIFGGSI